jgi:membrane associated rhomboid family serine protease
MKMTYNAPVILTLTIVSTAVLVLDQFSGLAFTKKYFTVYPAFNPARFLDYIRIFSHILGHKNWSHLIGNFSFILLIGPILEEKYGSAVILSMILVTGLITGALNIIFFSTGLMGASGIVFMLILLSSLTNFRSGEIPLTFVLIFLLFFVKEITAAFSDDNISQCAHMVGGVCGSIFGFLFTRENRH